MYKQGRHAAGLVDGDGKYVGMLSDSDLRGLNADTIDTLLLPCNKYLSNLHADATITGSDTFAAALRKMCEHHYHRLYVVDKQNMVIGVITLTDVLKHVIQSTVS
eukprot:TRINITY_DN10982_c0_g1_i2.p2 TRINITY_DN10982_c0_g1~~TRINITY_DN10982_c0_g1_i2.p2  ORF type:complete len:105 (+),score=25.09 TRINITY_DN10982_c0_g1_i2:745-1059(+)